MIRRPPRSTRTDTLFPYTTRFRSVWSEVKPVQAQLNSRETNTAFASLVRDEEPVAIARLTITPPLQSVPATIELLYPVSSLRAVEVELTANLHDYRSEERRGGKEWYSTCRYRWYPYH